MAKLTVRYHNSALPSGVELDIAGIGLIKNGGQITLSDEIQDRYEAENGVKLEAALKENPSFNLSGDETPGEKKAEKAAKDLGVERSEE